MRMRSTRISRQGRSPNLNQTKDTLCHLIRGKTNGSATQSRGSNKVCKAGRRPVLGLRYPLIQSGSRTHGFTLLELMFGVAIAAVLAIIAVTQFAKAVDKSKVGAATADMALIQAQIDRYRSAHNNELPEVLDPVQLDPWHNPYVYTKLEGVNGHGSARKDHALNPLNTDYDLFSTGKNGVFKPQVSQKDSLDDIIRARNGAYVGLAADF